MKIFMVVENLPRSSTVVSGGRYHALLLAAGLCEIGHEVVFITQHLPSFLGDFHNRYKLPEFRLTNNPLSIVDSDCDLVLGYPILWSEPALRLARKLGAKCWNFVLDAWPLVSKYAPAVARRMHFGESHTQALHDSDLILSISHYAVSFIKEWIDSNMVIDFIGCVNSKCADSVQAEGGDHFVTVTRTTEHKRFSDLLYCAKKTGIHLKVITSFDFSGMVNLIRQEGVHGLVEVIQSPSDDEKFRLMKSAVAYIGASAYEGLGMPFMEAVYCGLPVICYDYPVLREVCGEGALYANHSSPDSLAAKARQLLKDDFMAVDLSVSAQMKGKAYSFEAMCDRLKALF